MTSNRYKVPLEQWKKWSRSAQTVFNAVYFQMKKQRIFTHPKASKIPRNQWDTTRWNAAWIAAEAVDGKA